MKYLSDIKDTFEIEKFLTNSDNEIINSFVSAYKRIGKKKKYNYDLFRNYAFRIDIIKPDNIFLKKEDIIFNENNEIDFTNTQNINHIFYNKNSYHTADISTFIGYVYFDKKFVPLFIKLTKYDDADNYFIINGFTVWSEPGKYSYCVDYFNKDTTIELEKIDISNKIYFDRNDYDQFMGDEKFECTKTILKKYAERTQMQLNKGIK